MPPDCSSRQGRRPRPTSRARSRATNKGCARGHPSRLLARSTRCAVAAATGGTRSVAAASAEKATPPSRVTARRTTDWSGTEKLRTGDTTLHAAISPISVQAPADEVRHSAACWAGASGHRVTGLCGRGQVRSAATAGCDGRPFAWPTPAMAPSTNADQKAKPLANSTREGPSESPPPGTGMILVNWMNAWVSTKTGSPAISPTAMALSGPERSARSARRACARPTAMPPMNATASQAAIPQLRLKGSPHSLRGLAHTTSNKAASRPLTRSTRMSFARTTTSPYWHGPRAHRGGSAHTSSRGRPAHLASQRRHRAASGRCEGRSSPAQVTPAAA